MVHEILWIGLAASHGPSSHLAALIIT